MHPPMTSVPVLVASVALCLLTVMEAEAQTQRVIRTPQPTKRVRRVPVRVPGAPRNQAPRQTTPGPVRTPATRYRLTPSSQVNTNEASKARDKSTEGKPEEAAESDKAASKPIRVPTTQTIPPSFESDLWNYLERTKYEFWSPGPGETDGFFNAENPHGPFAKKYVNRRAAANTTGLPYGSILIMETYTPDQTLTAINVMFRAENYNAHAFDWHWVAYNPDGTVIRNSNSDDALVSGRVEKCIKCHERADGGDLVFSND